MTMVLFVRTWAFIFLFLITVLGCRAWPEGTYGIPMAEIGCPSTEYFEWATGSRTQETEKGSTASENIHLAGIRGDTKGYSVTQNFCIKTVHKAYGGYEWEKGEYCIFKKGSCPNKFRSGNVYWDDAASIIFSSEIQSKSGILPDGAYDQNTKIYFCCREDGDASKAISMPTDSPFYLLKKGSICQQVKNMEAHEEWVYWADEKELNLNSQSGSYPYMQRSKYPSKYTRMYYCYYTYKEPAPANAGMTVLYVVVGILLLGVIIFLVMCVVQRIIHCRNKDDSDDEGCVGGDDDSPVHQRMLGNGPENSSPEPSVLDRSPSGIPSGSTGSVPLRIDPTQQHKKHPLPLTDDRPPSYNTVARQETRFPQPVGPNDPPLNVRPTTLSSPPSYEEVLREKEDETDATSVHDV